MNQQIKIMSVQEYNLSRIFFAGTSRTAHMVRQQCSVCSARSLQRSRSLQRWGDQEPSGHIHVLQLQANTSQTNQRDAPAFNIDQLHSQTYTQRHITSEKSMHRRIFSGCEQSNSSTSMYLFLHFLIYLLVFAWLFEPRLSFMREKRGIYYWCWSGKLQWRF